VSHITNQPSAEAPATNLPQGEKEQHWKTCNNAAKILSAD